MKNLSRIVVAAVAATAAAIVTNPVAIIGNGVWFG